MRAPDVTCATTRGAVIEAVRAEVAFVFEEVDIESDDALVRDYGLRIPVVAVDGEELFEIAVDADGAAGRGPRLRAPAAR